MLRKTRRGRKRGRKGKGQEKSSVLAHVRPRLAGPGQKGATGAPRSCGEGLPGTGPTLT